MFERKTKKLTVVDTKKSFPRHASDDGCVCVCVNLTVTSTKRNEIIK